MSGKDKDKPMHEKLKMFFKMKPKEQVPQKATEEFVLTAELQFELSRESPIGNRLKAIRDLTEIINNTKMQEHMIPKVWGIIKDLADDPTRENRQIAIQVLHALVQRQKCQMPGIFRAQVFRVVVEHKYADETAIRFNLLQTLSENGKDISYFDEKMAPFLLAWIPEITKAGKTNDFLLLLITLIKFNAAHVKESDLQQFVIHVGMVINPRQEITVTHSLQFIETIIAYYRNLPSEAMNYIIDLLSRVVNYETYAQSSWKVMRNLLGTHLGHATLFTMCRILQTRQLKEHTYLLRGCVFFVHMAMWGNPLPSLRCPPSSVMPAILEASKVQNIQVTHEVLMCVQKMVAQTSAELQEPSWDVVLMTLRNCVRVVAECPDAPHTAFRVIPLTTLNDVLTHIEGLIADGAFNGDVEAFYNVIEECAQLRPEASIMKLIAHRARDIHPIKHQWMTLLHNMLYRYFRHEKEKRTAIRLTALEVLSSIITLHRSYFEDDLIDRIIVPHLLHLHVDTDVRVRSAGGELLVRMCATRDSRRCMEMLDIVEKLVHRPFELSAENAPVAEADTGDVRTIVPLLICLFESKIHKTPSMPAVRLYKILMAHLEMHYVRPRVFEHCNAVRLHVFGCFLHMRADALYRIGCPRKNEMRYSPYLCVTYSSPADRTGLGSPPPPNSPAVVQAAPVSVTYVGIKSAFKTFISCLNHEKDPEVLIYVLRRLPGVLRNKSLVLTKTGNNDIGLLIDGISKLMKNPPESASIHRMEFCSSMLLVLSGLASYHGYLYPAHQQEMIRLLCTCKVRHGVPCFSQCIRALTTCTLEMQDVMVKILPEVLLQLSKTTATPSIAIPMLEFLSTLTILPSVFSNFVGDQYMAIFAMLLPYTNPFNYNAYTVFLAHHLIAVWFLKCRITFRKDFVSYITNGLHTNALTPFDEPQIKDVNKLNQDSSSRKRSSSLTEQSSRKRERSATLVSKPVFDVRPPTIDKSLMSFYRELTETCIDLMARYTFSPCSALPKRLPNADFLFHGGQSMSWLMGNRVITVTTSGCAQKALKHGLCDKCYATCKGHSEARLQRTGSSDAERVTRQNSGSNNNTSASSPTEDARRLADKLEQLPNKLQQLADAGPPKGEKKEHCACWCQNWAEIHVRRPTGNMSWVMRIQNQTADVKGIYDFPLNDITTLFMPSMSLEPPSSEAQPMEVDGQGGSQPISIPGSPKQSPSRQGSKDSVEEDHDEYIVYEDGTRARNPVRRSNSSPEMSANWKNPFLQQTKDDDVEPTKKKTFAKDMRVSCEAIPEEIAGMGTTPPSDAPPHPTLLSSLSCPGPEHDVLPTAAAKPYQAAARPTLHLPLTAKPPQSPTQTSPRMARHAAKEHGHDIQKSASLVLQKQKKLDGLNQADQKRDRGFTISVMQSPARKRAMDAKTKEAPKSGINPAFVFLQLYHAAQFGNVAEKPLLINSSEVVQRALHILDIIQPFETHKIGVIYIGAGQCNKEADILRNCYGSLRYSEFLKRIGTMIKVPDVDPHAFFLGGLDHDGVDGKFAYMWQDDIIRVIFHVATLMPTNLEYDPNCNQKKAHIGNDFVTIVYNESGKDYNINTIKGQFNFANIIIEPLDHNSNMVTVKAKDAIVELIGKSEPRIVSDQNVALLARQLALHANLAALIQSNLMKEAGEPYAPNWLQRLRRIKNLRQKIQQTTREPSAGAEYTARTRPAQMEDFTEYT